MRGILYVLAFMTILACTNNSKGEIHLVSQDEVEVMLKGDNVQLVDVRTVEEYKNGSIHTAQNIDFYDEDFEFKISQLDKSKPVILYCQKGGRSAKCAEKMKDLGFTKIYDLDGGYSKWITE
jgi:rhodanese-related sulfurtransferase